MATNESWKTREQMLEAFRMLDHFLDHYARKFAELSAVKTAVLDDPVKKADLKLLFDQDTEMSMADVTARYIKAKTIADWLEANK